MVPDGNLDGGLGWKKRGERRKAKSKKNPKHTSTKKTFHNQGREGGEETKKKKDKHPSKTGARKGREEKDKEGQKTPFHNKGREGKGEGKRRENVFVVFAAFLGFAFAAPTPTPRHLGP